MYYVYIVLKTSQGFRLKLNWCIGIGEWGETEADASER